MNTRQWINTSGMNVAVNLPAGFPMGNPPCSDHEEGHGKDRTDQACNFLVGTQLRVLTKVSQKMQQGEIDSWFEVVYVENPLGAPKSRIAVKNILVIRLSDSLDCLFGKIHRKAMLFYHQNWSYAEATGPEFPWWPWRKPLWQRSRIPQGFRCAKPKDCRLL